MATIQELEVRREEVLGEMRSIRSMRLGPDDPTRALSLRRAHRKPRAPSQTAADPSRLGLLPLDVRLPRMRRDPLSRRRTSRCRRHHPFAWSAPNAGSCGQRVHVPAKRSRT